MAPSRQGRDSLPNPKEVAPRKERHAFRLVLLAAIVIALAAIIVARHTLKTQHEPVAVNTQNTQ
jgi:hypothetical protein